MPWVKHWLVLLTSVEFTLEVTVLVGLVPLAHGVCLSVTLISLEEVGRLSDSSVWSILISYDAILEISYARGNEGGIFLV